jgi:hypothetical protein
MTIIVRPCCLCHDTMLPSGVLTHHPGKGQQAAKCFLFSLACWAAAVGALAGSVYALVTGNGHTAWALVWAAACWASSR